MNNCWTLFIAVIIKGKRESVELKPNTAYSMEESKPSLSATNPAVYEEVDI
jgi:hypothetical protein